jgi:hypothetical protein
MKSIKLPMFFERKNANRLYFKNLTSGSRKIPTCVLITKWLCFTVKGDTDMIEMFFDKKRKFLLKVRF